MVIFHSYVKLPEGRHTGWLKNYGMSMDAEKKFHGSFHQPRQIGASQREQTPRGALDWDQLNTVCESHFMEKYGKNT